MLETSTNLGNSDVEGERGVGRRRNRLHPDLLWPGSPVLNGIKEEVRRAKNKNRKGNRHTLEEEIQADHIPTYICPLPVLQSQLVLLIYHLKSGKN